MKNHVKKSKAEDVKKSIKLFKVPESAKGFYDVVLMAAECKTEDTEESDDGCYDDESNCFV